MISKSYKVNCGFRRIGVCSFKEIDCSPDKCDMYNVEFNSKSIKKEMDKVEAMIKELVKESVSLKKVKEMVKEEKELGQTDAVTQYKKRLSLLKDLGKGHEYLKKAFIYCKRTGKV